MSDTERLTEALDSWERNHTFIAKAGGKENARVLYQAARAHVGCGTVTDEMVEAAAKSWYEVEAGYLPEDTEFGEELRWSEIDVIVQTDYRHKARVALEAAVRVREGTK